MIIRNLTTEDIAPLVVLWRDSGLEHRPTGRDSQDNLKTFIKENPDLCLCATDASGTIIGAALGSDDGRKGWINRLAVHPDHRKSGIAAALVKELENNLRARGRSVFAATIYSDNAASIELFKKSGFSLAPNVVYLRKADSDGE